MSTSGTADESSCPQRPLWRMLWAAADKRHSGDGKPRPSDTLTPSAAKTAGGESAQAIKPAQKSNDAFRETVESVVIAFVLAFLFRTFLAEAFVIPTGSMAPTLMGRHKDHRCTQCGHHYTLGASEEVEKDVNILIARVTTSVCPNCLFSNDVYQEPVYNGDRILVNKFPYEFGEPDRFDVFVFRYPEEPQINYIKRLVGLPGESLKIERGDLYARKGYVGEFHILRKNDPNKQRLLQQTVYDDRHPPKALLAQGWPERWTSLKPNPDGAASPEWLPSEAGWKQDAALRSFQVQAGGEWDWLRYRHLMPSDADWQRAVKGESPSADPKPHLIADFCGYNSHLGRNVRDRFDPGLIWVGDLTLNLDLQVRKLAGESPGLLLELVEGVRRYRCEFDLKAGTVTLSRTDDLQGKNAFQTMATASSGITGTGKHALTFANVDDRLCLWIDNRLVSFGAEAEYTPPPTRDPQLADLHPAGIAARGVEADVSHIVLQRDVYYRSQKSPDTTDGEDRDLGFNGRTLGERLGAVLSDPAAYNEIYNQKIRSVEFAPLDDDEFFAMGDNSTHSYDGRLWHESPQTHHAHAVNRRALIGKAFFIYWPHGIPFLNDGKGYPIAWHGLPKNSQLENYPLYTAPFYPQWQRWSRIR